MKKWPFMAAALAVMAVLPYQGTEIGKLNPVKVISVSYQKVICVETDTQDKGRGETLRDALLDLERTANGKIYLNTAEYLIMTEKTLDQLPEIIEWLRPSVKLCVTKNIIDPQKAAQFLDAHPSNRRISEEDKPIPVLTEKEGKYNLNS